MKKLILLSFLIAFPAFGQFSTMTRAPSIPDTSLFALSFWNGSSYVSRASTWLSMMNYLPDSLKFYSEASTNGSILGRHIWEGDNSAAARHKYIETVGTISVNTAGSEEGQYAIWLNEVQKFSINPNTLQIDGPAVNITGLSASQFVKTDGSKNLVSTDSLLVAKSGTDKSVLVLRNEADEVTEDIGEIRFEGHNDSAQDTAYATIRAGTISDNTGGSLNAVLSFWHADKSVLQISELGVSFPQHMNAGEVPIYKSTGFDGVKPVPIAVTLSDTCATDSSWATAMTSLSDNVVIDSVFSMNQYNTATVDYTVYKAPLGTNWRNGTEIFNTDATAQHGGSWHTDLVSATVSSKNVLWIVFRATSLSSVEKKLSFYFAYHYE